MDTYYPYNKLSFVWDENKNEANIRKHKISFNVAAAVFDDPQRIEFPDVLHSEDEERYITIGLVRDILTVVYCDRDNPETGDVDIRIISARMATKTEIAAYNNNIIGRY